jgi:hypothetical protein
MRTIQIVTSGELLTRQAMRKKWLCTTKNTYILKLLLNIITVRIEHFSYQGISFCMPLSKSLPPLSSAIFWHLPSTRHYCWSTVIPTSSSSRYTGGSHFERDQRCKESPSWNAPAVLKCKQLYAMQEHYIVGQHSTPFVLNGPMQFF